MSDFDSFLDYLEHLLWKVVTFIICPILLILLSPFLLLGFLLDLPCLIKDSWDMRNVKKKLNGEKETEEIL